MLGFYRQLHRLIQATKLDCIEPNEPEVRDAISKMRHWQAGLFAFGLLAGLLTLMLTVGVLPPYWFIIPIILTIEEMGSVIISIAFHLRPHRDEQQAAQVVDKRDGPSPQATIPSPMKSSIEQE